MMRQTQQRLVSCFGMGHPNMSHQFGKQATEAPQAVVDGGVQKTVLPNGATVISHDREGAHSTVGYFVDAGAKYDTIPGLSNVLRWAMLGGNMQQSQFQNDRAFRSAGASFEHCEANKRHVGWYSDLPRNHWKIPVEVIGTALACPRFAETDVERYRDTMDNILEERKFNEPRDYAVDQLEGLAYRKEPLGQPRFCPPTFNDKCSHTALIGKYAAQIVPEKVVLAAVNVDHQDLIAQYTAIAYPHSSTAPHHVSARPKAELSHAEEAKQFTAGAQLLEFENRPKEMLTKPDMENEAIVAIGWNFNLGGDATVAKFATALVVEAALKAQAESGINCARHMQHFGTRAFARNYATATLAGFTVRCDAKDLGANLEKAVKLLPTEVSSGLDAAKTGAKATFYNDMLERQQDYLAFIATRNFAAADVLAAIDAITSAEVSAAFASVKGQAPAVYGTGDVATAPSLRSLGFKF